MRRTSLYLEHAQIEALDDLARAQGVSRGQLIRRLLDEALRSSSAADRDADLAAIAQSFGVLKDDDDVSVPGPDERSRHLDRMWRR